jgi:hypothetical protein
VAIQHAWGQSFYGHLSTISAQLGTHVKKGQLIGLSGNTGLSSGPHLHLGMKVGDTFVNALSYLSTHNNEKIAMKRLVWPVSLTSGQSATFTYNFALPAEYDSYSNISFGSATLIDEKKTQVVSEHRPATVYMATALEELKKSIGVAMDTDADFTVYNNVALWINKSDDRILHGFDRITSTSFEQAWNTDKQNVIDVDGRSYLVTHDDAGLHVAAE